MLKFIYNTNGNAVGFAEGKYIYQLNGRLIGQMNDSHVHKVSGQYVGEFYKDMIVNLRTGNVTILRNCRLVPNTTKQPNPGNRELVNYGFEDVFTRLLDA